MKYCPACQRWNQGQPVRCNYCGRTWGVRLCPRGHANPPDAVFCSQCGRPQLSETAGPEPLAIRVVSLLLRLLKPAAIVLGILVLLGAIQALEWSVVAGLGIAVVLLVGMLRHTWSWVRGVVTALPVGILRRLRSGTRQPPRRRNPS